MRILLTAALFGISSFAFANPGDPPPPPPPAQQNPPPPPAQQGPTGPQQRPPPPSTQTMVTNGTSAQAPGALANVEVVAFDGKARTMTVRGADGKDMALHIDSAAVAGMVAVGKRVDVTFSGDQAQAVSVR